MVQDMESEVTKMCKTYGNGTYANALADNPLCSTSYIECLNGTSGKWVVRDGLLGNISTPDGTYVPAVYNAFSTPGGASLPGALGTENCDCDAIYGETDSAIACKVCNILQVSQICNTTQALDDTSYSCTAPVLLKAGKGKISHPDFYVNCGLSGAYIQNGTVTAGKAVAAVVLGAIYS
ncbi:hypothetical protein N2152v2_006455 [Parachlorella kessleri]